jgi:hypothetical protein
MKEVRFPIATLLLVFLLAGGIGFSALIPAHAATSSTTLNNVQVLVQTTNTGMTSYSLTAYNSSGYDIASSTSSYPGFGLELPSGTYLITVMATQEGSYYPIVYASGTATASLPANSSSKVVSTPIEVPVTEYGYLLQAVNGPITLNIKTAPLSNVETTKIQVGVSYVNGTGASDVWVDASVVGGYYYDGLNNAVMSNQTVADGSTTLVVPNLPILLQAYISLPVNVPQSTTTETTTVGGQPVNVTMYWEPNYVELTGTALIIPPQTTAQMTLQVEQSNYYVTPLSVGSAVTVTTVATISNGASPYAAGNSTANTVNQIPPFTIQQLAAATATSLSTGPAKINLMLVTLISIVVVLAAVAGIAAFRFRPKS